ncbi:MAG: polysaccharide biosynthesis tyrosine autokinase, partial [Verrucomicrobiota bacterium]
GFVTRKLDEFDRLLSNAANDTLQKKEEYDQYIEIPDEQIERVLEIGQFSQQESLQKLLLARNQQRAAFVKIKEQFRPGHPTYIAFKSDLDGLEEEVRTAALKVGESIEKQYLRAVEYERELAATVQKQKEELLQLDDVSKRFRALKRQLSAAYVTYDRLLDRINGSEISAGVDNTVVRVFSEPLVPTKPVAPKKTLTVLLAAFFGGFCGLGLVLAIGLLDRTLQTRKQVESTLGLTVLASVPKASPKKWDLRDAVTASRQPGSLVYESFRSLRTSLSTYAPRSVLITSAGAKEGKSFCAANLALLQASMGYRTLLVDADFCRPRMSELFVRPKLGTAGESGLVQQNICEETIHENLYLISCGRFTYNTGEPMNGDHFASMLQEAYASFDCVIIDTSPLSLVSDGLNYSRHADAVVLVVKAGETRADHAKSAVRELQRMRASLVGVLFNGSDQSNRALEAYVRDSQRSNSHSAIPLIPGREPEQEASATS